MALTSPSAFWEYEATSGQRNDSVGTCHLTDTNTVGTATGKVGNAALTVLANQEYFTATSQPAIQSGDINFTWALWVKPTTVAANMGIVSKGHGGANPEYFIYITSGGNVKLQVAGGAAEVTSSGTVTAGVWVCIIAWHDATNDQLGISLNAGSPDTASYAGGITAAAADLNIGAEVIDSLWSGVALDQTGYFKHVFSSQDRTDFYNSGNGLTYAAMVGAGGTTVSTLLLLGAGSGIRVG